MSSGKHHAIFISAAEANSSDYKEFWQNLRKGKYQAAQYKRLGKSGKEV
jgi:methyl-accepting chemotaxis protein